MLSLLLIYGVVGTVTTTVRLFRSAPAIRGPTSDKAVSVLTSQRLEHSTKSRGAAILVS